jgi:hypothetical protein
MALAFLIYHASLISLLSYFLRYSCYGIVSFPCVCLVLHFFFRPKALPSLGRAQNQKICRQFDAAFLRSATGCSDLRNAYQFDFCVMASLTLCVAQLLLYLDSRMIEMYAELGGGLCVACLIRQFDK